MFSEDLSVGIWERCIERLEGDIPDKDLSAYLRPLRAVVGTDLITLYAPNKLILDRVRSEYLVRIRRVASASLGYDVGVNLAVGTPVDARPMQAPTITPAEQEDGLSLNAGRPDQRYTLDTFIEGKSNSQARAAGLHVAANPGVVYNPLLIYGGPGLGKSHLMHGIGNTVMRGKERARVVYVPAEVWFNQMVAAIRFNRQDEFKNFYRTVDALLIDDVHFLAGKERSQEEFFHTFNALIDGRRQIVLTCDRYPRELDHLDERLKTRFTWGLSVPIEPPELETRVAILLAKAEDAGFRLPEDVAMMVAQRIRSNVRDLEGALHRLTAASRLTGAPITVELARSCLKDMLASYDRTISLENIKRTVAAYYNMRLVDLNSARRTRSVSRPRQIAMALSKELTRHSYPEIGESFGKDHTTVLHACRKILALRESDERLREDYENLLRTLAS